MANPMNAKHSLKQDNFTMDFTDEVFTGYHNGGTWNGWEMPSFEYDEAMQILDLYRDNEFMKATYDAEADAFTFLITDEAEADIYTGFEAVVGGETKKLYDIGSGYWTWEIAKEDEEEEEE